MWGEGSKGRQLEGGEAKCGAAGGVGLRQEVEDLVGAAGDEVEPLEGEGGPGETNASRRCPRMRRSRPARSVASMRTLASRLNPGALRASKIHEVFAGLASRRRATRRCDPKRARRRPRGAPGARGGHSGGESSFGSCAGGARGDGGRGRWLRGSGGRGSGWWGRCPRPPCRARPPRPSRRARRS